MIWCNSTFFILNSRLTSYAYSGTSRLFNVNDATENVSIINNVIINNDDYRQIINNNVLNGINNNNDIGNDFNNSFNNKCITDRNANKINKISTTEHSNKLTFYTNIETISFCS